MKSDEGKESPVLAERMPWGQRLWQVWQRLWLHGQLPPSVRLVWARMRVRHRDWVVARALISPRPPCRMGPPQIHFYYPVYDKHFPYLLLSIRSLLRLQLSFLGRIYVYQDAKAPLTPAQENQLKVVAGDRLVLRYYSSGFLGLDRIWRNLDAWAEIVAEIGEQDYLAKCDADILWVREAFLQQVLNSGADMVSHCCEAYKYLTGFVFSQGGIICMRAPLLAKMPTIKLQRILEGDLPRLIPHYAIYNEIDDATFYVMAQSVGARILLEQVYLPSLEAAQEAQDWRSIIHYEGELTKEQMLRDGERLLAED